MFEYFVFPLPPFWSKSVCISSPQDEKLPKIKNETCVTGEKKAWLPYQQARLPPRATDSSIRGTSLVCPQPLQTDSTVFKVNGWTGTNSVLQSPPLLTWASPMCRFTSQTHLLTHVLAYSQPVPSKLDCSNKSLIHCV